MIIAGIYSFKNGEAIIRSQYPAEFREVEQVIAWTAPNVKPKLAEKRQCLVELCTARVH